VSPPGDDQYAPPLDDQEGRADMTDFSTRLRRATMVEHREAETRSFISRLMAGDVPMAGFAALTAQYLAVYRELESAAAQHRAAYQAPQAAARPLTTAAQPQAVPTTTTVQPQAVTTVTAAVQPQAVTTVTAAVQSEAVATAAVQSEAVATAAVQSGAVAVGAQSGAVSAVRQPEALAGAVVRQPVTVADGRPAGTGADGSAGPLDPELVSAFADPALTRAAALEADLAHLYGPDWESTITVLDSTRAYTDRLRDLAATSPTHFIAHHYVRYLGDLSGGQMIGRTLSKHYGLGEAGTSFYRFDRIPDPRAYKIAYRERLDALNLTEDQATTLIDEAQLAFRFNAAVFVELGALYPENPEDLAPAA
jgi:heme oxygenase